MPTIKNNISSIQVRLQQALRDVGRSPDEVLLLAVSKTRSTKQINQVLQAGLINFGENYLQEAIEKIDQFLATGLDWHFIGPLQSNKTRLAAEYFSWIHSVDRLKIAQRLSAQRPTTMKPLNLCLQINIDHEPTKSGFSPEQALAVASEIAELPNISLRGLMAIPRSRASLAEQRVPFARLRELKDQINTRLDNSLKLDTLSMGMSGDMEAAILEGATIVRIGTDIFGPRDK
ncbi:YggS family pyridoxal phosphate-dependent enzyme [SAR92 clade bacterium H921]|jgi:pyridoxal phosphate enzyme (YggS family)|nr:YggS family pyridoxal phosphate-dependent enzyme [SAR92 clade bacterium H921]MDA9664340.1 YggS family pyridoxal phosphate-dependent enzyme [bacterium]MDG0972282.1 YggS family pyridoxal phosphate-dependent enzyme [Porticoccaceae bacterium]MDG1306673.1 YggS family pyridoxal phosphate-dependent enzyme [Porticoccaceae bacterium]